MITVLLIPNYLPLFVVFSLSSQRQLLEALGFIITFRWKPARSNRIMKLVS